MNPKTKSLVRNKFHRFYEEESHRIVAPSSIERREFGILLFNGGVMVRHKGFSNIEGLRSFLVRNVPLHAYYSTAYYESPEEKMESKGWLGADLYFDIDADHIATDCRKVHDKWTCKGCSFSGKGIAPETCPICGGRSFDEKTWPCNVCLESAKQETVKLVEMLTKDFGFALDDVMVSFSGHRGYHVHVENEEIQKMDSMARKEIVDYVTGTGLEAEFHGLKRSSNRSDMLSGPRLDDFGWRGRIARGTYEFLKNPQKDKLLLLGLKKRVVDALIRDKALILQSWDSGGPWNQVKGVGPENWKIVAQQVMKMHSAKIDTVVTTDIHRLIRLTNTLHGKTGLMKVAFSTSEIEGFDPFREAVAFKEGEATIFVEEAPEFGLGDESFGPFRNERIELPMAPAMLLLCKGLAEVA
ncbi:MAG: DNA primase small subunit PriS [Candidatus Bathyarchaeota archaeon]|nr:DNA primase small subunit PriS [Candidatus Bathyarchaeota archaeon]